jgi:signal transduction histidine kinase/CheY-like chemotaxis protein
MPRGRILIADDNPDILRLVEVNLKFEEYETLGARNGEEALELARRELPDLIILDVMLGRMDGWQVLSQLKADPRTEGIPVVIMTGSSLRDRRERDLVRGVADFLSKPFNPLRLLEVVREHLQDRRRSKLEVRSPDRRTRVVMLHGEAGGTVLLQNLLGNPTVEIVAVVGEPGAEGLSLARDLNLATLDDIGRLDESLPVDVYIDTRNADDPALLARAARQGAEVLSGRTLQFLRQLLAERDASHLKERDLVHELRERVEELSILNEMARLVSSPFDIPELYKRTLNLTLRIAGLSGRPAEGNDAAGVVLIYDEQQERFVPAARIGLSERFQERARLSLSDPMVDEVLTLHRPITISEVSDNYPSALMAAAYRDGLASMACLPLMVKDKVIGMLVVGMRRPHIFRREEMTLLSGLAAQMGMVIENAHLHQASRQKQVLIEQLLGKVIQAQEDERKRLAAEIHDSVAQSLAGMLTQTQICQSLLATGAIDQVSAQLASIRSIIADSVREVRQIIFNLRPSSLDDLGLLPSLENYVKRFERDSGLTIALEVEEMPATRLPSTLETTIFRIVQESLTNIKKHARARQVRIRLRADGHQISLKIVDDGQGFKWPEVTDKFYRGESHGVEGMKERTALLGGTFHIHSQEGAGTVVRVDIPLRRPGGDEVSGRSNLVVESSTLAAVGHALARLGEQAESHDDRGPEAQASRKMRVSESGSNQE